MVLQGARVTCTKEHSASDHPGNTLPLCKPMNEALMQQPKNPAHSWHADARRLFFQDWHKFPIEWYNPYKVTSYINNKFNIIPYKMSGTNPAKISNCILILAYGYILYDSDFMPTVNHLFDFSYNMARCRQLPTKWLLKRGVTPWEIRDATKWLASGKWFPTKWPYIWGFIWAWRLPIPEGKFNRDTQNNSRQQPQMNT